MNYYLKSFIIVFLSYGVGLYSPAASGKTQRLTDREIRSYVNGKHTKSVKDLLTRFESSLPSDLYEDAMKKMGKKHGNVWFSSAKMGPNYVYMRVGKIKLFARLITEKNGEPAVLLNGQRIKLEHFRNYRHAQTLVMRAFYKEYFTKKGLFSFLAGFKAFAGKQEEVVDPDEEAATIPAVPEIPLAYNDDCQVQVEQILAMPLGTPQQQQECERAINEYKATQCQQMVPFQGSCAALAKVPDGDQQKKLAILLGVGALALVLFLMLKNKNKDKKEKEVPENEDGTGRTPPILCEGDEANCGEPEPEPEPCPETGCYDGGDTIYVETPVYYDETPDSTNEGGNIGLPPPMDESSTGTGRGNQKLQRARVKTQ